MKKIILLLSLFIFLNFVYAECSGSQIDINSASLEELDKITYVGPATAEKIIASRPFDSVDGLLDVSGIGETKLAAIKTQDLACVGNSQEENSKAPENNSEDDDEEDSEKEDKEEPEETEIIQNIAEPEKNISEDKSEPIKLTPQIIKTQESNENQSNNFALYGLAGFSCLIILLVGIKFIKQRKEKNEFQ